MGSVTGHLTLVLAFYDIVIKSRADIQGTFPVLFVVGCDRISSQVSLVDLLVFDIDGLQGMGVGSREIAAALVNVSLSFFAELCFFFHCRRLPVLAS